MAREAPTYSRPTREYLLAVHEFVDLHPPTPQYPRDRPRLQVLCNALEVNDWDYLIIHQIYCLLEDAPEQLPPQILQHPGVGNAQDLLNHVLDSNALLSPELRLFFINMPHPMSVYTSLWPLVLQQHCDVFIQFAAQATNINNLHSMCRQRNFPPFAGELFHDVGIGSFTLQKLLFTAAFRHIMKLGHTPRAQHLEERALDIFRQNYMAFANSVKARPGDPYEPAARAQEHGRWSARFLQMCKHRAVPNPPSSQQQQGHIGSQRNQPVQPPTVLVPNYNALYNSRPQAPIDNAQHFGAQSINAAPPSQQGPHATDRPRLPMSVSHDPGRALDMRKPGSPLLPAAPFRLPQQRQPVPARFALHQAHLRSPTLKARQEETILYQYVDAFAVKPTRLVALGGRIAEWKVSISDEQMRSIPTNLFNNIAGAPSARVISQDSQLFRLRCITWNKSQPPSEHEWATAPTSWCPSAYFTFNNQPLEMRKKIHYGKSLPVDLTPMIKPGENVLKIGIVRPSGDESYQTYLLAIEIVTTARHDTIVNKCVEENCLSAPQVKEAIIQRLSGSSLDDEEIAIIQNNLTIGLLDPFSASKMCDIPARGRACLHNECFDLETFLKTRDRHGDCSVTDKWRCPICTADARPQHLVVDAFLQSVYAELDRDGLKGVREIVVNQDGEWVPKAVPREDSVQDHSTAAEDRNSSVGPARTEASRLPSADIDIIDIIDISD
ncbi:hypothetical protein BU24DRAFT_344609 [Aaosphaeria arxii CBS 175.79]|uniref:SP-RING-type domain-containing protein n=1 Tax=Aaosphaeria arxii CBS 175.79 TaxID=1450172 RepID=A0A6A5XXS5_9PLEO|nr:uncharacterized protein BU24DRAFT_344609 [Aaosphaeria arxii CBS 175.79]KAF2017713.1 hypothetical protein BU24DRAFT_344609 [Aaosphaeria arxii CBS 175.79]